MSKILKFIVLPFLILIAFYFSLYFVYPQIPTAITFKILASNRLNDSVNISPRKHQVGNVASKQGKRYEFDGISIVTDWKEKDILDGKYSKLIKFSNDEVLVLNGREMGINLYSNLKQEMLKKSSVKNVETYFSNSNIRNDKDIYEKMLSITNDDISVTKSMDELTLNMILLMLKKSVLLDADEILKYNIGNNTFYQYSPLNNNTVYEIVFFDSLNKQRSINIHKKNITQQEIESIVKTIEYTY